MFFSWLYWGYGFWGERSHRQVPFHPLISEVCTINMPYHCGGWPWSPGWHGVCQVSSLVSYSFFPLPSHFDLWRDVTMLSSHLQSGELFFSSLRMDCLHDLFGITLHRIYACSSLFTYLFNHLFRPCQLTEQGNVCMITHVVRLHHSYIYPVKITLNIHYFLRWKQTDNAIWSH